MLLPLVSRVVVCCACSSLDGAAVVTALGFPIVGNAGVTLSEDELKANPKFVGLLGELFEQFFTPECCSKDSKEELEQVTDGKAQAEVLTHTCAAHVHV